MTYENEESIAAKGAWVKDNHYGGTINGYLQSNNTNPLMNAVKNAFLK